MPRLRALVAMLCAQVAAVAVCQAAGVVNPCTEASLDAALSGGGLVTFACSGTIQPANPKVIEADTVLDGTGQAVTLNGLDVFLNHRGLPGGVPPLFRVDAGSRLEVRSLTFSGIINNGSAGAAILNQGTLVVRDSTFSDNVMLDVFDTAAAIINRGSAEIHATTFSRNQIELGRLVHDLGGAIWSNGTLFVGDSTFTENGDHPADGQNMPSSGAAILLEGGVTTISGSLFAHNLAGATGLQQGAGAIMVRGMAFLTIVDSIFHHNRGYSGALDFRAPGGALVLSRNLFEGNESFVGGLLIGSDARASIEGTEFLENIGSWVSAISSAGTVEIRDSVLRGNLEGVAILNDGGAIDLRRVTIDSNVKDVFPPPPVEFGDQGGAGLWNRAGVAVFEECVITNNVAREGIGTIVNDRGGRIEIRRSELSGNRAAGGSALLNADGSVFMSNSTVYDNVSTGPLPVHDCVVNCLIPPETFGRGGALFNAATLELRNVTIARNATDPVTRPGAVSGLFNAATGDASLYNVILVGNGPSTPDCLSDGTFTAASTLVGHATGCPTPSRETSFLDVRLGAPAGSPAVLPLLAGSLAIDRGDADVCAAPPVGSIDQRGFARPFDGDADGVAVCDIGAYESTNRPPAMTLAMPSVVVDEGQRAENSGTFSDPDGDAITFRASVGSVAISAASEGDWFWVHLPLDGPDSTVVRVEAGDGSAGATVQFDLVVRNVPPELSADPPMEITSGDAVTIGADFTDPSPVDTHTATIDFGQGDGPQPAAVQVLSPRRGRAEAEGRYLRPGSFTVTICVTDDDGGRGCATTTVEVRPIPVVIDIKPGGVPNSINLRDLGVIPVAVLSSVALDATTALPLTICFGDAEDVAQRDCREAHGLGHSEDVNRDGRQDLVLHFETLQTGIDPGDSEACLTGELPDGRVFAGCDSVRVLSTSV